MKKKFLALIGAFAGVATLAACGGTNEPANNPGGNPGDNPSDNPTGGGGGSQKETITIWASETEGVAASTQAMANEYLAANNLADKYTITVAGVSESKAASDMISDVEAGADIYCFAQDQLARLIQANAIVKVPSAYAPGVKTANSPVSIDAGTVGETLYAYPMTADNGYFMYYNKDIITDDAVGKLEDIVAACEAAGKKFSMQLTGTDGSAWYGASFYFGAGCVCDFEVDDKGNFAGVNDTIGDATKGLIGAQGAWKLLSSDCYVSSSSASDLNPDNASPSAVVISGTWDYNSAVTALGDKLGVAKLPTYTVNGTAYQMGSFTGCKLLGVKPQTTVERAQTCHGLANYIANKDNQLKRFNDFGWGPSNIEAQNSEAVKANATLNALNQQNAYATVQGQFHDSWWTIGRQLADNILAIKTDGKDVSTSAKLNEELAKCIETYSTDLNALFEVSSETYYILVGEMQGWANNKKDLLFTKKSDNVYELTLTLETASEWGGRIVELNTWQTDKGFAQVTTGADLLDGTRAGNDNNMVFAEAGTYVITLDLSGTDAVITIVKQA